MFKRRKKTYQERINFGRRANVYRKHYVYRGKRYASKHLSKTKYPYEKQGRFYRKTMPLFKNRGW